MANGDPLRTFVGVPLRAGAREAMLSFQAALRSSLGDRQIRWERAANLHGTLQFLGDTDPEQLELIALALRTAASGHEPFELSLGQPDAFGGAAPRVIVVGVEEGAAALRALQADLAKELQGLGFQPEDRPFRPHFTVGRVRRGQRLRRPDLDRALAASAEATVGATMTVEEIVHYQSELSPAGATYRELCAVRL